MSNASRARDKFTEAAELAQKADDPRIATIAEGLRLLTLHVIEMEYQLGRRIDNIAVENA
jgi:hypothetical protein